MGGDIVRETEVVKVPRQALSGGEDVGRGLGEREREGEGDVEGVRMGEREGRGEGLSGDREALRDSMGEELLSKLLEGLPDSG